MASLYSTVDCVNSEVWCLGTVSNESYLRSEVIEVIYMLLMSRFLRARETMPL